MDFPTIVSDVSSYGTSPTKSKANKLDQDAFLKILITQIKNQNPLEPMDDKDFISQMATFSSLEQMEQMSSITGKQYGTSLLGKGIIANTVLGSDGLLYSAKISGRADGIVTVDGEQYLQVGDYRVPVSAVQSVFTIPEEEEQPETGGDDSSADAATLA